MTVHFQKNSEGKFTLHCIRKDGTQTWQKYHWGLFQVEHDLMHFVVETTLGFTQAFYGLLASGKDISWFAEPDPTGDGVKKPHLPGEAGCAETLVGALQTLRNDDEFFENFPGLCALQQLKPPVLSLDQVIAIRQQVADYVQQWKASKSGITLEFKSSS